MINSVENHDLIKWGSCFTVLVKQELASALIADWRCTYLTTYFFKDKRCFTHERRATKQRVLGYF